MEMFRRLGVAEAVRRAGLPADYPNDMAYRTTMTGPELTRIPIPCRRDRYIARGGPDTWWPTPEPPHRINQIFLEPVLFAHAATQGDPAFATGWNYQPVANSGRGRHRGRRLETGEAVQLPASS